MSIVKNVSRLAQLSARQLSTSPVGKSSNMEIHEGYKRLKDLQAKYQLPDGKPVHLKRAGDKALMYITFAACAAGLAGIVDLFYTLS
ncbi:Cytochrome c oxidase subunit 7A, mitochondrial [Pseudolycoriella hygida]|uniref:Cytochrome c oxidase subunit 7A, mitochondrial n=1 Tax=Pseudolycoriella hygida TaxID=35572 RepID=A0A9Q0MXY3_9DIPT|nr:Cytochrome c oxidase subunit 7A, mitochondrial [Pseudolycoriella hygida]